MPTAPAPPAAHPGRSDATPPADRDAPADRTQDAAAATADGGRAPLWRVAGPGLVVGAVTGLWGLAARGLWLDEAYSLGAVHQLGRTFRDTSGTMAAYYALLRGWTVVSESVWWMRALSVACALAAIAVATRLATRIVPEERARLAAVVTPLSFLWLVYARQARSYALVMVLVAAAWLALDHVVADDAPDDAPDRRRRWWLAHLAVTAILPLAHGLALIQVVPQAALLVAARADRAAWVRFARSIGAALVVTGGLLAMGANQVGDWVPPLDGRQAVMALRLFTSLDPVQSLLLVALVGLGVGAHVRAAAAATAPVERARALLPVAWALGPVLLLLVLSVVRPSFIPRYVVGCVPAVALLLAGGIDLVAAGRRLVRLVVVALVLVVLATAHLDTHRLPADGWTTATELVATEARPGDAVLLPGDRDRPPFEAAWRQVAPPPLRALPGERPLGEVLRFEPDERDAPERWRSAAADGGRIWLVADADRDDLEGALEVLGSTHRVASRVEAGSDVTVVLLVPR